MESYLTTEEFVAHINQLRRDNKNKWYFHIGYANNKFVEVKGYNTWLQILRVEHMHVPTTMANISVTEFKRILTEAVK